MTAWSRTPSLAWVLPANQGIIGSGYVTREAVMGFWGVIPIGLITLLSMQVCTTLNWAIIS